MKLHPLTERDYPDAIVVASSSYYDRMVVDCATEYADLIQNAIRHKFNKDYYNLNSINDVLLINKWSIINNKYKGNKDFNEKVLGFLEYYWFIGDIVVGKLKELI